MKETYHQPEHRFKIWSTQMASPSHIHAQVQSRNTYNHTYIKFLSRQNNLPLNPDKPTCPLFTPDPAESGPQNKQHCTTHGNAPKGFGPYLTPKTHIQHAHSQHLSTSTQATTNDKSTHRNRMGKQKETQAPTAPHVTIQRENTTSITFHTQTYNILQLRRLKIHYV